MFVLFTLCIMFRRSSCNCSTIEPDLQKINTLRTHCLRWGYTGVRTNLKSVGSQYRYFICHRYIDWSRRPLVRCKLLLFCSHMVRCTRIAYRLIHKSHAIHSYCRKRCTSGVVHCRRVHAICHHWLVSFHFPTVLFQVANFPTMTTVTVFSVVFGWLIRPTWFIRRCSDRHRLRLRGWRVCHERFWLCRRCRCLQPLFDRKQFLKQTVRLSLVVIKRLPDTAKLLFPRSHCCKDLPMQQFNRYVVRPSSTQLCIHIRELLLNFSDIAAISISGSL